MDNTDRNNATGSELIGAAVDVGKSVQQKLILRKAKKKIAEGKANELSGREIDICLEAGIDPKTFENNPKYMSRPEVIAAKAAAMKRAGAVATDQEAIAAAKKEAANTNKAVKTNMLFTYGALAGVLILIIYLISKK